ncbi:thiol:disulfide interchange protein DsbC [Paenalcaligenes hominis]|uniref:Thiol:disulfide interchange protein n=1 Tax=Paenalcaligenes hominis TaxID=643674 RepID=A0ABX0WQW9_9BURK|nr:DsbC family protein [Paenalcaligenes hominis]NJB65087.1 thiol:disulfide interchange protein DsbC [Paenalcaligenes hominis]GGE56770.1 putative thiol:disulfide interchange protein DsbC [Paenalcaligenes hominis]
MKLRIAASLTAFTLLVSGAATAAETSVSVAPEVLTQAKERFESQFDGIVVDEVSATPFDGILELRLGKDVLYTNSSVDFILQGSLVDVASRTDLTAQRLEQLNRVDFSSLPLDKAIKTVKGDGSRQLVVFEDPNCIYCKRLHQSFAEIDNLTVYSLLYPILSPDSKSKSEHVLCAEDPAAAWSAWMVDNKTPTVKTCDNPIDELLQLGLSLGVQGTPALFFEDGSRANGWLPPEQLEQRLQNAAKK